VVFSFFGLCLLIAKASGEELPSDQCLQLGFVKANVQCSRCKELTKYDLDEIKDTCLMCCQSASEEAIKSKKYASARLEYCTCNLANFPQIQAFIKSDRLKEFPYLSVKHVRGTLPIMKLMDLNENVVEELSVHKWDTDTVVEFLREHLSR